MERCDGGLLDDADFHSWLNLVQAHSVVASRIEARLEAACGLSLAEHELLVRLSQAPDRRLRMYDLASLLLLSKSGITRLVDRLERRGLVERKLSEADRRVILACMTNDGVELLEQARPFIAGGVDEFFTGHLNDDEIAALRSALRKVLEGNGEWVETRCSPTGERDTAAAAG
jgi:DNA-binding MarR family transcriptional regulator